MHDRASQAFLDSVRDSFLRLYDANSVFLNGPAAFPYLFQSAGCGSIFAPSFEATSAHSVSAPEAHPSTITSPSPTPNADMAETTISLSVKSRPPVTTILINHSNLPRHAILTYAIYVRISPKAGYAGRENTINRSV